MSTAIGTTTLPPAASAMPVAGGGAPAVKDPVQSPVQQTPVQQTPPPASGPVQQAQAGNEQLLQALQQLITVLQSLVQALQGAGSIGTPPVAQTTAPTQQQAPAPTSHLNGFIATGDAGERVTLEASLAKIASTSVGASLLAQTSNAGIHMDIMSAAEFDAATGGKARDAAAVFRTGGDKPPAIYVNADAMSDPSNFTHVLAHELAHAQQHIKGENAATYAAGIGTAATGMTAQQLEVGATLMREAGAEVIASSINAQLQDPVRFAQVAGGRINEAAQSSWQSVNISAYNPSSYPLPVYVSPSSLTLVSQALAA